RPKMSEMAIFANSCMVFELPTVLTGPSSSLRSSQFLVGAPKASRTTSVHDSCRSTVSTLQEEREQTGGHERGSPDQIEVEPCLAKKGEAELTIDYPREQARDGKIGCRMDQCGENSSERTDGGCYVMVTCYCGFVCDASQKHR